MKHLDVRHCGLQDELKSQKLHSEAHRMFNAGDMLTHSPAGEELRRFLRMLGCHTMTAMKQDFGAVQTMLKRMPAAKFTAFLKSMACAQQAVAEKTSFALQSLENHHTADWTSLCCVALGILACLLWVAFHVGKKIMRKE